MSKELLHEVQLLAKDLKTKDPSLKHKQAVSKAWEIIKQRKGQLEETAEEEEHNEEP